jgi:hypothetical protein
MQLSEQLAVVVKDYDLREKVKILFFLFFKK